MLVPWPGRSVIDSMKPHLAYSVENKLSDDPNAGQLKVDPIVLAVPFDTAPGSDRKLEVGLYTPTDGKRLSVIGLDGRPVDDKVSIKSFRILE